MAILVYFDVNENYVSVIENGLLRADTLVPFYIPTGLQQGYRIVQRILD